MIIMFGFILLTFHVVRYLMTIPGDLNNSGKLWNANKMKLTMIVHARPILCLFVLIISPLTFLAPFSW